MSTPTTMYVIHGKVMCHQRTWLKRVKSDSPHAKSAANGSNNFIVTQLASLPEVRGRKKALFTHTADTINPITCSMVSAVYYLTS